MTVNKNTAHVLRSAALRQLDQTIQLILKCGDERPDDVIAARLVADAIDALERASDED